ncbi:MAG: hypothetical protein U0Q12_06340 [Vicinamibacterales bacterium]
MDRSSPAVSRLVVAGVVSAVLGVPTAASAAVSAATARVAAFEYAYNLDHEEALHAIAEAVAAAPADPAVARSAASIAWLEILFARGAITVDEYLGSFSQNDVNLAAPPPELAKRFNDDIERALRLAERAAASHPDDAEALYQLGATVGLQASYVATVEGRVVGAFRAAKRAYDSHERVLALAPARKDAGLIVGTYRYLVATLSLPVRWLAYVAGFGGGKERGLALIEQAAASPNDAQSDARFALVLLYNRERRFDDALRVIGELERTYPRNRLLWLEQGATELRAAKIGQAEATLSRGLERTLADRRGKAPSELALWYYKRAVARRIQARPGDAQADLDQAEAARPHPWVRGRIQLERGRLAVDRQKRDEAARSLAIAVDICRKANDAPCTTEATELLAKVRQP